MYYYFIIVVFIVVYLQKMLVVYTLRYYFNVYLQKEKFPSLFQLNKGVYADNISLLSSSLYARSKDKFTGDVDV